MPEDTIDNYAYLFKEYINKPPTLSEALYQMYISSGFDSNYANEKANDIISKCINSIDKRFSGIQKKYKGITKEDAYIICSYTIGCKDPPYSILNRNLLSENDKVNNIKAVSKYLFILLKSLRKLPRYNKGILYRSIQSNDIYKNKKIGNQITYKTICSVCPSKKMALSFIRNKGTICIFEEGIWGYDIEDFSFYKEKEILIEPGRSFIIKDIKTSGNYDEIVLKMLDAPLFLENPENNINANNKIKQLEKELSDAKNLIEKQKKEIEELKQKLNQKNNNENINELKKEIEELKKELKKASENNPNYVLVQKGKLQCINFISTDQNLNYAIPCTGTDIFAEIEEKLYQEFPEYRETNNRFLANGREILRFKTVAENKIGTGKPVILDLPE